MRWTTWRALSAGPCRKVTVDMTVSTFAGDGTAGYRDGPGAAARFNQPAGITVSTSGNVTVADYSGHRIRQITPEGVVSTLAGSGQAGFGDGPVTSALFNRPVAIAVDSQGVIFVADHLNHRIRRITPQGVTTLAGSGSPSFADAQIGTNAGFNQPAGIAVGREGNVFVSEYGNHRIRKITPGGSVTTLAGGGGSGSGFQDGPGADARFNYPGGIAVDGDGNVFVADWGNHRIRQVTPDGTVTTVAGSGAQAATDGTGTAAAFDHPRGIAIDPDGSIIVTEVGGSHRIHKMIAGLTPPQGPAPPQPEVASSTYFEEMKGTLGDRTHSDVAFVVKHVDHQAGG